MLPEERVAQHAAHRRRIVLSWLRFASFLFHLLAIICIILLMVAGTYKVTRDTQADTFLDHAGNTVSWRACALVQFRYNLSPSQVGDEPQIYWFLNALAWTSESDSATDGVGFVSRGAAQTLRFPDAAAQIVQSINETYYGDEFKYCNSTLNANGTATLNCTDAYNPRVVDAFGAIPPLAVSAAPAFVFYIIALALTVGLVPLALVRCLRAELPNRPPQRPAPWKRVVAIINAGLCTAHLVASACVTGAAFCVKRYLTGNPSLAGIVADVSVPATMLVVVWCAFAASVLGTGLWCWRQVLYKRWDTLLKLGSALEVADARESTLRRQRK